MEEKEYPTPINPIPIEKQTQIIELERRDVQSEIRYWNKKYIDTFLELVKEKEKNKKLQEENKYLQDYLEGMEGGLKEQIKEQQKQISELQAGLEE